MSVPISAEEFTRRGLLERIGYGIGSVALTSMLAEEAAASNSLPTSNPLAPKSTVRPARAKNVIYFHMVGAPSHLDLFHHKPALNKYDGQECPPEYLEGARFAFIRGTPKLLGSEYKFQKHGEAGQELSELLPNLAGVSDEMAMIHTLHTEQFNHAPAQLFSLTGFQRFGRPTVGSWVSYGLGSENRNLPSFVVMNTGSIGGAGNSMWGSGFLPTIHQGVEFRSSGDPVLFLSNPAGMTSNQRKSIIDGINYLNKERYLDVGDPEIATRIGQYEMAFRMQSSVPELMETADEPEHIHKLYGTQPGKSGFANNCLLARRLVERGVRFVQLFDQGWDHHGSIFSALPRKAKQVDQPIAALITDLKQRGLLDDTLIVWGAEFGRTPLLQADRAKAGRDHHKDAYTIWMAGGGIKGGSSIGTTDELGYFPVENPVTMHDFHATLLHLLGIDHEQLTYKYQGRNFRLTDVAGEVLSPIIQS